MDGRGYTGVIMSAWTRGNVKRSPTCKLQISSDKTMYGFRVYIITHLRLYLPA